jgi:hypothetical protein
MTTPMNLAVSRLRVHVYVLVPFFAAHAIAAQTALPPRPAGVERPSAEVVNQLLQPTRDKQQRDGRSASARGAMGSVAVAARCVEGYVVSSSQRASASDVRIVAAERRDCDGRGCRSYQVTAARDSAQPFDLDVSVTCS